MPATSSSVGTPPSGSSPAPRYTVLVKRSALRALDALPAAVRAELVRAIDALAENPRPVGTKKPARHELYRLRVAGRYRIVWQVDDAGRSVLVVLIGDRKDVYRGL